MQDLMVCELMDANSGSCCREVVVRRQLVISHCLPHQILLLDQTHMAWKLMVCRLQMLAVVLRAATSAAKCNRQTWLAKHMFTPQHMHLLCIYAYVSQHIILAIMLTLITEHAHASVMYNYIHAPRLASISCLSACLLACLPAQHKYD